MRNHLIPIVLVIFHHVDKIPENKTNTERMTYFGSWFQKFQSVDT
jgi:hypothetical protein